MEGCFDQLCPCLLGSNPRPGVSAQVTPVEALRPLGYAAVLAGPKTAYALERETPCASPVYYFADDFWRLAKPSKIGLSGS
jgi:hypothetical protein